MSQQKNHLIIEFAISKQEMDQICIDPHILLAHSSFDTKIIATHILDHLQDLDGAPELNDFKLSNWQYNPTSQSGKF